MTVINTTAIRHITCDKRKSSKLLTCTLCVLLALPGLAAAKKPPKNSSTSTTTTSTDSGCAVLVPTDIYTGQSFSVKVVRVPSYPGSWHSPTIVTVVTYPTMAGGESQQTDTQTINYFSVTYATANFTTPSPTADASGNLLSGILTTATSQNAVASITAMVSEPLSNGKTNTSTCSATTTINLADVVTITP